VNRRTEIIVVAGLLFGLIVLASSRIVSHNAFEQAMKSEESVSAINRAILQLVRIKSRLKDAETGQRGYLLTGDPLYLQPYNEARTAVTAGLSEIPGIIDQAGLPHDAVREFEAMIAAKMAEEERTIAMFDRGEREQAIAVVKTDEGKHIMDQLRAKVNSIEERMQRRAIELTDRAASFRQTAGLINLAGLVILLGFMGAFGYLVLRDLAGRRRAEAELARQQEWLRTTLLSIGDGVIATDEQGRVVLMNEIAEQLTGWKLADAKGKPHTECFRIINAVTREPVESPADAALKRNQVVGLANHSVLITRDGKELPIDDSGAPIRDAQGKPTGAVLVFRDVTERYRAELELRDSERFTRSILDGSGDCIKVIDADGNIESMNAPGLRMMEIDDIQAVRGKAWPEFWSDNADTARAAIADALAGQAARFQGPCRTFTGRLKWWDVLVSPMADDAMGVRRLVSVSRDITDQRRSEAALTGQKRVLEQIARGDEIESIYASVIEIIEAHTDIKPCASICTVDADGRLHTIAHSRLPSAYVAAIDNLPIGESVGSCGTAAHRRQSVVVGDIANDPLWANFRDVALSHGLRACWSIPILSQYGNVLGTIAIYHPQPHTPSPRERELAEVLARTLGLAIERKATEAERERLLANERTARSEAERVSRVKDEFVATLSHELRTPLNAILGWAQLLRRGPTEASELSSGLETIERNARVQSQMIEDLLDMSRIVAGKVRLDIQRVDLPKVVAAAIETIKPAAEAKGIRLQAMLDPRTNIVHGDPTRLQQAIWNLLSNAVKFTPKGGKVQIVLERVNSHIEITVSDTGRGIKPEFLPHVFERFRQEDASTTRKFGGLGLGLAIVKQLVELHGGTVRASSGGEDQGSVFVIELPLAMNGFKLQTESRSQPVSPQAMPLASVNVSLDSVKVLVVDDEQDSRELIRRVLVETGADVMGAGSVREALDLLPTFRPDVILSDIGMPEQDGYELIRRVRNRPVNDGGAIPAAALTALARSEDRTRALLAGFQVHVPKPIEPSELIAVVQSLAALRQPRAS